MSAPAKKSAKPRQAASHPPLKDMITAAVKAIPDRKGATRPAIRAYILANYKVSETALVRVFNNRLRALTSAGYLLNPKDNKARFKLAKAVKEQAKGSAVAKKKAAGGKKKPAAKKQAKADSAKKAPSKKPKAKKAAGAKKSTAKKPAKKTVKKVAKKPAAKKSPKKSTKKGAKKATASKKK